jgi:hypothetical protein
MAIADTSENPPDHSPRRNTPKGWRVISNPIRQPDPAIDELKTLIQTMLKQQGATGKRLSEETDPPEAA